MIATAVPEAPSTTALERDWRFAELVVWAHLDPALRTRYAAEPAAVLAEFGLVLTPGAGIPPLDAPGGDRLVITDVDDPAAGNAGFCQITGRSE
ncbi:hypothetical protein [Kitasatospora mediocidica]|uniref:hypothetical protein n=1 Tax=Kitasatospora mediocidica TaxID=58352 RepID=UPI00055C3050|nr:hypothetical protein [Kitasatospora mediocidica]